MCGLRTYEHVFTPVYACLTMRLQQFTRVRTVSKLLRKLV